MKNLSLNGWEGVMEVQLSERKIKILQAIIRNYLETGEPVGSRTISKYTDLNLSSATIRNEMSDLEEMGYILQPHTSAGRIPSDKGYRLYVDTMMEEKDRELEDRSRRIREPESELVRHNADSICLACKLDSIRPGSSIYRCPGLFAATIPDSAGTCPHMQCMLFLPGTSGSSLPVPAEKTCTFCCFQ